MLRDRRRTPPSVSGKPHTLPGNKATPRPRHMLFLDTETLIAFHDNRADWHRFDQGWTCYYRRRRGSRSDTQVWRHHDNREAMVNSILDRAGEKRTLYVFASNPSFDLWILNFYAAAHAQGWQARFLYDSGLRYILSIRREKAKIVVLAVQNYFRSGIAELGDMLGLPKQDVNPLEAPRETVKEYCRRDTEILRDAVLAYLNFCDRVDAGGFALTISSQAFNCFRHRYLDCRVWVHREEDTLALERSAYFGGRTEAFRMGTIDGGPFQCWDVNSLYPYVMQQYSYPTNLIGSVESPDLDTVRKALRHYAVVADVELNTERPLWPVRLNNRTVFPVGSFATSVCSHGLALALSTGALRKVKRCAIYDRRPIFRKMVTDFYARRERHKRSGNHVMSRLLKDMLNSLYGKFGQANPELLREEDCPEPGFFRHYHLPADGGPTQVVTLLMGRLFVEGGLTEHKHSLPAIVAHVTEYARAHLQRLITLVGWDRVLYCDTDSLFIRAADAERLGEWRDDYALGHLSLDGESDTLEIRALKDYVFGESEKIKGVQVGSKQVGPDTYHVENFPGLKTLLATPRDGQISLSLAAEWSPDEAQDLQRVGLYPVLHQSKHLSRDYLKGKVTESGRVVPYRLSEFD